MDQKTKSWPASLTSFYSAIDDEPVWNDDFQEFVRKRSKDGVNIDGKASSYVAYQDLLDYWSEDKLMQDALNECGPVPASSDDILDSYLRIWSTLVFIGKPGFIEWFIKNLFSDNRLPDHNLDRQAEDHLPVQNMLRDFDQHRWQFLPLLFNKDTRMYDRSLDPRQILPITFENRLTPVDDGGKTTVWKVRLHDSCCEFEEKTVVFKIYKQHPQYRSLYNREKKLLPNLPSEASEVIVNYFGSFNQNGKSVIILEFASGGNLASFLETTRMPETREEFYKLWTSLISLINAIYHLNNLTVGKLRIGCAHRDIKFENILVFPGSTGSEYDFTLKLADFDTISDIQKVSPSNDSRQYDDGGRVYCAPEASRVHEREQYSFENIPLSCDIWSLGALFSDIIVWLADGVKGIKSYEEERKKETKLVPGLWDSGYGNCFHDGLTRLKCVGEAHKRAMERLRKMDDITPLMKNYIERVMLVPHAEREEPKHLYRFLTLIIEQQQLNHSNPVDSLRPQNAPPRAVSSDLPRTNDLPLNQKGSSIATTADSGGTAAPGDLLNVPSTPDIPNNPSPVTSGTIITAEDKGYRLPSITVENANAWLAGKKKVPIRRMNEVLRDIKGRDQLFVIDDSITMAHHKDALYHTIKALFAFACEVDPDRVEVVFASEPKRFIRDRRFFGGAEHLARKVLNHFDNGTLFGKTNMESKLSDILHRVSRTKKTSIYVMTDGVWQPSGEDELGGGVERPLRALMERMIQNAQDRDFTTLQFIHFGNDPVGLERLEYLDDGLAEEVARETNTRKFDIVDHRRHDDNVSYMLMGAYSSYYDAQDGRVEPNRNGLTAAQESYEVTRRRSLFGLRL